MNFIVRRLKAGLEIERFEGSTLAELNNRIPLGRGVLMGYLCEARTLPKLPGTYRIEDPAQDDEFWFVIEKIAAPKVELVSPPGT